jgi:hypothetical protein
MTLVLEIVGLANGDFTNWSFEGGCSFTYLGFNYRPVPSTVKMYGLPPPSQKGRRRAANQTLFAKRAALNAFI